MQSKNVLTTVSKSYDKYLLTNNVTIPGPQAPVYPEGMALPVTIKDQRGLEKRHRPL